MRHLTALALCLATATLASATSIEDFTTWSLVEDPAHPGMTAEIVFGGQASLSVGGTVPPATDIGYASVDGIDVAEATGGHYFDPSSDFAIAVDFNLFSQATINGVGVVGVGIGEDRNGTNSAGIGLGFSDGEPLVFSTAGRVRDTDKPLQLFATPPTDSVPPELIPVPGEYASAGRLFVEYVEVTGDVTVGVSTTAGAALAQESRTLAGIGREWDGEPLLVSFFLRSETSLSTAPLTSGFVGTTFSNFEVLSGTPIRVPEPATAVLLAIALLASRRRSSSEA